MIITFWFHGDFEYQPGRRQSKGVMKCMLKITAAMDGWMCGSERWNDDDLNMKLRTSLILWHLNVPKNLICNHR